MIDRCSRWTQAPRYLTPFRCRWTLPVLVGLLWMVVNYAAPQRTTAQEDELTDSKESRSAVAAPFNVAAMQTDSRPFSDQVAQSSDSASSAAPIWGDAKGAAFVLVRNPPCKPACREPVVREFEMRLTRERM